ncbi:hypothetical protein R3P38DRAFT_2533150 [Favolaschia claudopus]|uniref:NB-ARC domain-containing protein n=1 Tax=Favolaschia claudopus TaxID=2862362 RepID=A0AAW0B9B9_9AGAR
MSRPATSHITLHLSQAAELLAALQSAFSPPFIHTLSTTATTLADALQNVKQNQDECNKLAEHIPTLLTAIVDLHMKSKPVGTLSTAMLHHVGEFTETLAKIYTYVEAQLGGRTIRHFFRQDDTNIILKACFAGLELAKATFKINVSARVLGDIVQMQSTLDNINDELLELIASVTELGSEANSSVHISSIISDTYDFCCSSGSLSVLPAKPTIFHGREMEVASILKLLQLPSPRIAILGAGGMGKTSLARVILHEGEITACYETRIFVSCDATNNGIDIANNIGSQLGLKPAKDIRKMVVHVLEKGPACLLILDNLETPWEPLESRVMSQLGLLFPSCDLSADHHVTEDALQPLDPDPQPLHSILKHHPPQPWEQPLE